MFKLLPITANFALSFEIDLSKSAPKCVHALIPSKDISF